MLSLRIETLCGHTQQYSHNKICIMCYNIIMKVETVFCERCFKEIQTVFYDQEAQMCEFCIAKEREAFKQAKK